MLTILDRLIDRVVTIYLKPPSKTYCDICNTSDHEHIPYTLTIKNISNIFMRKSFKLSGMQIEKTWKK